MAQPTAYDRQYSFGAFQQSSPSDPLPAARIDAEYNAIKVTLDQILANLALIQRDDGELANNSVGVEQIDESVSLGFSEPTVWVTATAYAVGDCVFNSYKFYICETAHTSGTFATDLAASKWGEIADFTTVFADASGYADAAAASATTASIKATEASASAAAALVSQSAAAASAVTAAGYAAAYKGTSTSSVAIGTGSKGFTTQSGKFFDVGVWVLIASDANEANYMHGRVTAYSGTSLTVEVTNTGGSGTLADWTITVAGTRGAAGATGASGAGSGDMLAAQNLNDVADKPTAFANIKQAASATATGVVELATNAETATGTDTTRAVTPANIASLIGSVLQAYSALLTTIAAGGAGARTALGLAIGTDVQAYSAVLAALAAQTDLAVLHGGTGASDAAGARSNLGAAPIPTTSDLPVGWSGYMRYTSGTSLSNNAETDGANVRTIAFDGAFGSASLGIRSGDAQTGTTWKNISGEALQRISSDESGNQIGLMVRTA